MRHIPARGRKLTLIALLLFIVLGMRHIPARGRKLVKRTVRTAQVADASHPRKGTEPQNCLCCHTATQDVSHPHQGTETYSSLSALHHPHHRCVTSPRGDGNIRISGLRFRSDRMCHIPARGRKHDCFTSSFVLHRMRHIPARGRKPGLPAHAFAHFSRMRHIPIPARGRKRNFILHGLLPCS